MAKQHKKPCHDCPFTRKSDPGETGGSPPEVYIAQTILPYWVPCHCAINYEDPNWKSNHATPQCVGHAMMRHKMGIAEMFPEQLLRIEDKPEAEVFDSLVEMYAYHYGISLQEAQAQLTPDYVQYILYVQINSSGNSFFSTSEGKKMLQTVSTLDLSGPDSMISPMPIQQPIDNKDTDV